MLLTSTAMRELEERAFAVGVSADALMEEAGLGIARVVRQFAPRPGWCIAVFGKGNNGGDALVAVRHLVELGWEISLLPAFPQAEWSEAVLAKFRAVGSPAVATPSIFDGASAHAHGRPIVVLDGLLGTGARGGLRGSIAELARSINALRARSQAMVVALDLPTGLDGDIGEIAEDTVVADVTVTIGFPKAGLVADSAAKVVGRLAVVPLTGLEANGGAETAVLATGALLGPQLARRNFDSHKGDSGRVGIVAGSRGMLGAAVLTATAALRAGAGLVTVYSATEAAASLATMCPPEVMVHPVTALGEALSKRHDMLAIGPGLGHERADEIRACIARCEQPMVIDADALNALAGHLDLLREAPAERVLTPHPGEMERLAPGALAGGRRPAAEALAARFPGCTVLLKGSRTVIAKTGQPTSFNSTGTAGMAVGGMGDTLTGVIAALIGQRHTPWAAARLGAWLCGRAGEAAISQGRETEETLTPSRLADHLAHAFRDLRAGGY